MDLINNNACCKCTRDTLGIIFWRRGQVSTNKKIARNEDVNVYFQVNAWAERTISIERGENTIAGCFRNKNVLKLEAGMLGKIRTF